MAIDPAALGADLRAEAEALVRGCVPDAFVRFARGEGLLVSDAPGRGADLPTLTAALTAAGWRCAVNGGLLALAPAPARIAALEAACGDSPVGLARSLAPLRGRAAEPADMDVLLTALKCAALREDPREAERRLRRRAAVVLRTKAGGGGLYLAARVLETDR